MTRYAYRLETRRIKEPDFPYMGKGFTHPEAVAEFCRALQDSDVERMIVLHLTTKNSLIGIQFFTGTVDRAVVHPREILKYSLLTSGTAIILVHNLCEAPHNTTIHRAILTHPRKIERSPRLLSAAPSSLRSEFWTTLFWVKRVSFPQKRRAGFKSGTRINGQIGGFQGSKKELIPGKGR